MKYICRDCGEPLYVIESKDDNGVLMEVEVAPCQNCIEQIVQDNLDGIKSILGRTIADIESFEPDVHIMTPEEYENSLTYPKVLE